MLSGRFLGRYSCWSWSSPGRFSAKLTYLVVRVNKPLPCLYQHEPQPGQLTNYVLDILLFVEENLLEPPYRVGVYLSQLPSIWAGVGLLSSGRGRTPKPCCVQREKLTAGLGCGRRQREELFSRIKDRACLCMWRYQPKGWNLLKKQAKIS